MKNARSTAPTATRGTTPLAAAVALCVAAIAAAPPAGAVICTLDNVPAATLLLPYFEVNLADPYGQTTLFTVANASAAAALAHVVLWTDMAIPTFAFDVYLTGYDLQSINLRDIFVFGRLPQTADPDQDPEDTISPKGQGAQDVVFPNCQGLPPAPLDPSFVAYLRAAHTGAPSPLKPGTCYGFNHHDVIARGYVTVDTVVGCSSATPVDSGYFGPGGLATSANVLWGDYFYVDSRHAFAEGGTLVRIEADPTAFKPGDSTFYELYDGHSAADAREPLPTTWAARFLSGGPFDAGSAIIVWREAVSVPFPFLCNGGNGAVGGFPLKVNAALVFDEQEYAATPCGFGGRGEGAPSCNFLTSAAPLAANRVQVGGPTLAVPFNFGWIIANFDPGFTPAYHQAWMGTVMNAHLQISVGMAATPLDSGCGPERPLP
jgi:hypothetical protein